MSYASLGEEEIADGYYEASVALDPHFAPGQARLGEAASKAGSPDKALEHWKNGALDPDEDQRAAVGDCLVNWASVENSEGNSAAAAYLLQWAKKTSEVAGGEAMKRRLFDKAVRANIPATARSYLDTKTEGFSTDDMAAFVAKAGPAMAAGESTQPGTPSVSGGRPVVTGLLSYRLAEEKTVTLDIEGPTDRAYKLENSSDTLSIDGRTITWKIPAGSTETRQRALLSYMENGVTQYQIEELTVQ